jgi:predicted dehydrogenase
MLRGVIIGLGSVALRVHVPAWTRRADVEIVAVTDITPEPHQALRGLLASARWHDSIDSLLSAEELDFVDICTPPASHAALVSHALKAGLHVMCEKPLVCSPAEFASLAELATTTGRVLHTVHNWHHAPIIQRATELVRSGALGHVSRVVWHTLRTAPARGRDGRTGNWRVDPRFAGGGILTDHGWHVFYLIQRWLSGFPVSVSARLDTRRHLGWAVEDTAIVRVTYPKASAELFLTWAAERRRTSATLFGSACRIELDEEMLTLRRNGYVERWPYPPALSDGSVHPDWFDPEVDQFLGKVTGALNLSNENLAEASVCAALEGAARESSRHHGRAIPVLALSAPGAPSGPKTP